MAIIGFTHFICYAYLLIITTCTLSIYDLHMSAACVLWQAAGIQAKELNWRAD